MYRHSLAVNYSQNHRDRTQCHGQSHDPLIPECRIQGYAERGEWDILYCHY